MLEILGVNPSKNSLTFCIYDPYSERYLPREIIELLKSDNLSNLGDYSTPRGFLCMSLIKALESSVDAFSSILDKIIDYHTSFLDGNFSESSDDLDESSAFPQRLQSIIDSNYTSDLSDEFYSDVQSDLDKLQRIKSKLASYNSKRDFQKSKKFKALKKLINSCNDIKSEKLIIFTESIVTADALTDALKATFSHLSIESITGNTSSKDFSNFKKRFSPKSLHYELKDGECEIDILVATDCLSEGQNLQDCANLLNWDIAFNPVRAIQRIGRIWRIGSKHELNNITHFFPDMKLEEYIDLEAKLRYKLEAANSATALENPFSINEKKYSAHKDLRAKQLKAMESEFIALEPESNAFANLSNLFDFTTPPPSHLQNGIFSIALNSSLRDLPTANRGNLDSQNLLFALLENIDSHTKSIEQLYPCIYDISSEILHPSVSQTDKYANLFQILPLKKLTQKPPQEAITSLETLTNDYRDIGVLKRIFADLTKQLNEQIQSYDSLIEGSKQSDGGLFFVESKRFRLIAWLLINPDFSAPQFQNPQFQNPQKQNGGTK
ncbi:C-terminal helicase domain-containing protein [Helicobacter sp. 23-1044]